ncbi:thaumatin [Circinella umbellata]|nr:thaumatin [Circinella umbellata]
MYISSLKVLSLAALASLVSGAKVIVKNQCGAPAHVGQQTNGNGAADGFAVIAPGADRTYTVPDNWAGRFWGRTNCAGEECTAVAGAAAPASLAEIAFNQWGGNDFYDVSFVDGFNLPMKMEPVGGKPDGSKCTPAACAKVPDCTDEAMKVKGPDGKVAACKSACSAYQKEELCCTGAHNTPETCGPSENSKFVKAACPDAYSYAYDDPTSTFACHASTYNVIFCP